VAGALVAAVRYQTPPDAHIPVAAPAAITYSDGDGCFHFTDLSDATYGFTATAPQLSAGYTGNVKVTHGAATAEVDLRVGGEGDSLRGVARDRSGAPVAGADVRISRFSDVDGDAFYAVSKSDGSYEVKLPPAQYFVIVVKGAEILSEAPVRSDPTLDQSPPSAVSDWLRTHAVPIATVDARHGFADLAPLRALVGDAHVVALGEATHGTSEFFRLKHRLLEFLVSEMGFTVFAMEATMPESFDVNDYVLTGKGDPAAALAGLYFWTWNTEEVLDMIHWMRSWNADPAHHRKVKFYGFDMQASTRALRVALAYLARQDAAVAQAAKHTLAILDDVTTANDVPRLSAEAQRELVVGAANLVAQYDAHRAEWSRRTSVEAWALARQHARIVQQNIALLTQSKSDSPSAVRDQAMAENVRWIAAREGPDAKMVLWAHNYHVSVAQSPNHPTTMGDALRRVLGADLVVFGFVFNQGSFHALDSLAGDHSLRTFTVPPAPVGSLDGALAATHLAAAALDLRTLPKDGEVHAWMSAPRAMRSTGAIFSDAWAEAFSYDSAPALYDALLFVDKTTPAHSTPSGQRAPNDKHRTFENLDFEDATLDVVPAGWSVRETQAILGYAAATTADRCAQGARCAMLTRTPGPHAGESFGALTQTVDASAYLGKHLRVRAAMRFIGGSSGEARLCVQVTPADQNTVGTPRVCDVSRTVRAPEWTDTEVEIIVPADAGAISIKALLIGEGTIMVDDVQIVADTQRLHP
jgi:erythromycin esterase